MRQQSWELQNAQNKSSEVIENAIARGPQIITRHGVETAVVLSFEEYQRLVHHRVKLSEFFRQSPLVGVDLDLSREPND